MDLVILELGSLLTDERETGRDDQAG